MRRSAALVVVTITILGCLGGFLGDILVPVHYQAEAYVVVYEMPKGFTELISPDEANSINAVYRAGALQDSVVQRVQARYSNLTASDIRASVQVSIVAYTPLTRVTATAGTPEVAVALANAVANAWASVAGATLNQAYDTTRATLLDHKQQLNTEIATTQSALAVAKSGSTRAQALTMQLQTLQESYKSVDASLADLESQHFAVAGNAYVATPASAAAVTKEPSMFKSVATGGAIGFSLGFLVALWLTRRTLLANALNESPALATTSASNQVDATGSVTYGD